MLTKIYFYFCIISVFIILEYYKQMLYLFFQVETVIDKSRADPPTDAEVNKEEWGKSPSKVTFSEEQENTTKSSNNTIDNNELSVRATYRVSHMDYLQQNISVVQADILIL